MTLKFAQRLARMDDAAELQLLLQVQNGILRRAQGRAGQPGPNQKQAVTEIARRVAQIALIEQRIDALEQKAA